MVSLNLITGSRLGSGPGLARASADGALASLAPAAGLEDALVGGGAGAAVGLGFWLARSCFAPCFAKATQGGKATQDRLIALVVPRTWEAERGRLMARGAMAFGVAPERFLVVRPKTEGEVLWALEEVLRSGAVDLAVGAVKAASLTQTRRLDMAARQSGALAGLIRVEGEQGQGVAWPLSAARRRWRVKALPSADDPWDARAPGAPRWRVELARRRDGPPGCWDLEWNDATGRLDLVEGLAGDGLGEGPRKVAAR